MPLDAPLPPQDIGAEESVLGAMMLSPKAVEAVSEILDGREFYYDSHAKIYRAIQSLYLKGIAVDGITVVDELKKMRVKDVPADRVHEIAAIVPAASNAAHYANIVRETSLARELVMFGQHTARLGYERPGPINELVAQVDGEMLKIQGLLERKSDAVYTGKQLADRYRDKMANPESDDAGIPGPFKWMSRLRGGRLYVLAGYQGHGKTALGIQFVRPACEEGKRVGIVSIEMSKDDLTDRLVSSFGVPYHQVRTGNIESMHQQTVTSALEKIESWDFEVIDDESIIPSEIRRRQRKGKYDLLIVDHLHRIRIKDPRHQREELEESVRQITNITREFEIPILLLAQLSRAERKDPFPRPHMAALRGSGMIEAEASAVWFVWRKGDEFHQPGTDAEFVIAKNRHGEVGFKRLTFVPRYVRFTDQTGGIA